ncbi:MAG: hypothetical protein WKF75_07160 [Singulisphaera sp.]
MDHPEEPVATIVIAPRIDSEEQQEFGEISSLTPARLEEHRPWGDQSPASRSTRRARGCVTRLAGTRARNQRAKDEPTEDELNRYCRIPAQAGHEAKEARTPPIRRSEAPREREEPPDRLAIAP